jgi:hypothetical protein
MTDDGQHPGDGVPHAVDHLVAQLSGVTEKLVSLTGLGGLASSLPGLPGLPTLPSLPSLPRPAALSEAQLKAVTSTVAAQRRAIEAMTAQLRAFDDQLAVMEDILEPLTEWVTVWADLERSATGTAHRPGPPPAVDP